MLELITPSYSTDLIVHHQCCEDRVTESLILLHCTDSEQRGRISLKRGNKMAVKLVLCIAIVVLVVGFCEECSGNRRYDHLKAFEKFSPYPWTQWLRFHPSAAAYAAVADLHRTPPPVLIPPIDPARFSTSREDEDDDDDIEDDDDDDDTGFGSFFKRGVSKPLNISFWTETPSFPLPPGLLEIGYSAAQKSLFLAKLFDALAKTVMNSTQPGFQSAPIITTTKAPGQDDDDDNDDDGIVLVNEIERSVDGEGAEDQSSETSTAQTSQESSPTTAKVPTILDKKLDFLQRLNALISTTPAVPISTSTTSKPPKLPKLKSLKSKSMKTKKVKSFITTTTVAPSTTTGPVALTYEDVAKMILDVDQQ